MAAAAPGYITLTFIAHRDDETKRYVSNCVELGISSSAKDLEQAFDRILEAAILYLNTLEEIGERERIFTERGIQITPGEPPQEVEHRVDVRVGPAEYAAARDLPVPAGV